MPENHGKRLDWRGRRVLITGHTGFKGAWFSLWLQRLGAEVTGYSLAPPSEPSLFDLANVAEGMRSVRGDVRDLEGLLRVFRKSRPEIVLHLAAQTLVRPGYEQPVATIESNVMGTVHVLEAVRRTPGVRATLIVTSDRCYENREHIWPYRENEPMGGQDPYSSSKACAELVTASYRSSFFIDSQAPLVASARAGNIIGGGDWAQDRLIPDLVRGMVEGRTIPIRSPEAVWPWQHVLDALHGYLLLTEQLFSRHPGAADGWNFGPESLDARPVSWVVDRLLTSWHRSTGCHADYQIAPSTNDNFAAAPTLTLDSTKAKSLLGWRPSLNLDTALDWIVEWTRCYQQGGDLRALCEEQIGRYEVLTKSPRQGAL